MTYTEHIQSKVYSIVALKTMLESIYLEQYALYRTIPDLISSHNAFLYIPIYICTRLTVSL